MEYRESLNELEKFGEVVQFCQAVFVFEFKITNGFTGKASDTLSLFKLCQEIAGERYRSVSKLETDKNLFHLRLERKY